MKPVTPTQERWKAYMDELVRRVGSDFVAASDHPGHCRCPLCLKWWVQMGPDEDDLYGPFTPAEIEAVILEEKQEAQNVSAATTQE